MNNNPLVSFARDKRKQRVEIDSTTLNQLYKVSIEEMVKGAGGQKATAEFLSAYYCDKRSQGTISKAINAIGHNGDRLRSELRYALNDYYLSLKSHTVKAKLAAIYSYMPVHHDLIKVGDLYGLFCDFQYPNRKMVVEVLLITESETKKRIVEPQEVEFI